MSCNDDTNVETKSELTSEFQKKLNDFNDTYQSKIGYHPHSNNKCSQCWGSWGDFFVVAGADIAGAGAGAKAVSTIAAALNLGTGGTAGTTLVVGAAIVTGVGASVAANNSLDNKNSTIYKESIANLNIKYPEKFDYLKNIGKFHNDRVYVLLANNIKDYYCYDNNKTNSDLETLLSSQEWNNIIFDLNNSISDYNISKDIYDLTENLNEKSLISTNSKLVLNSFFNIYNQSENSHNIEDIINFYIDAVASEQSLTLSDKESLISSFSVASESPYFWINN